MRSVERDTVVQALRMEIHFANTGTPQHCANAIAWLTSDQSSKTTGAVIPVDGGLTEAFLRSMRIS